MRADPRRRVTAALGMAAALIIGMLSRNVLAADKNEPWNASVNLGGWLLSATGDVGVGRIEGQVDASFADIISNTNFVIMGGAELGKANWLLIFNGMYATLSDDFTGPLGFAKVDADATMGIADLALGYTILRTKLGSMPLALTPVVGARYTHLALKLDPERLRSVDGDEDWVDPYIGGRVVLGLTNNLGWRTEGTVGGFDVGSNFTWSAATFLDWRFSKSFILNVGYRALSWDFEDGRFLWDMTFHGPWIGLTFQF